MICLTFDIEERFHSHLTPTDAVHHWESRTAVEKLLDFLSDSQKPATFFTVADWAVHYPDLVNRMVCDGHEVASHSMNHTHFKQFSRSEIIQDALESKKILEDIAGTSVIGFRAPSWSAQKNWTWFWDALAESGFQYDSSLFPFRTHLYGRYHWPTNPYRLNSDLWEFPPAVHSFGPVRIPFAGGFYFRLLPQFLIRTMTRQSEDSGNCPVMYFHPWEFYQSEIRPERGWLNRFIGGYNIAGNWECFKTFLSKVDTVSMQHCLTLMEYSEKTDGPAHGSY